MDQSSQRSIRSSDESKVRLGEIGKSQDTSGFGYNQTMNSQSFPKVSDLVIWVTMSSGEDDVELKGGME